MKYIKKFESDTKYNNFVISTDYIEPHTSAILDTPGGGISTINYNVSGGLFIQDNVLIKVVDKTKTTYNIPDSIMSIGNRAFDGCRNLTSITIPNSVTSIGQSTFYNCSSLTSITIPNSVTNIEDFAFSSCSSLTSITIPDYVTSIGKSTFVGCTSLTSITIPDSVTSIENYAFSSCTSLTSITIPDSVTNIGNYAFQNCSSLTSITIPNSVTNIVNSTFYNCSSLTSITIPNSVTSIGSSAFSDCSSLTSITIPNSVTSINYNAFSGCILKMINNSNLDAKSNNYWGAIVYDTTTEDTLYIRDNEIIYIKDKTKTTYNIPDSVTSIGDNAFRNCRKLDSITIPNSVTSIGNTAFSGCIFYIDNFINKSNLNEKENDYWGAIVYDTTTEDTLYIRDNEIIYIKDKTRTTYNIPDSVTSIGDGAFTDCLSTIPDSVTSIGDRTFQNCTNLTSINIPNSVTNIGNIAFMQCTNLTSITIPDSVTSIGYNVFQNCSKLTSINYIGTLEQFKVIAYGLVDIKGNSGLTITCTDGKYDVNLNKIE